MIELYVWNTPNGQKIPIFLEEAQVPYRIYPIRLSKGEQKQPDFLALNPNGRIPAIVDTEGPKGQPLTVFESAAILLYLADKFGQFISSDPRQRVAVTEWLIFQVSGVGPMFGQAGHFLRSPERNEPAIERYVAESQRLLGVLEYRLGQVEFLAGEYSIADMATYPWIRALRGDVLKQSFDQSPNIQRWFKAIDERPAVMKALHVLKEKCPI